MTDTLNNLVALATKTSKAAAMALSAEQPTSAPASETIPFSELLLLSLEQRFGRLCTSLETTAKAATAGANNIEALTAQVTRLADALDAVSNTLACVTESVEGQDGVTRCFIRHDRTTNGLLSYHGTDPQDGE